jgi:hypothetical protein
VPTTDDKITPGAVGQDFSAFLAFSCCMIAMPIKKTPKTMKAM